MLEFEWDDDKDDINRCKHGVALEDGIPVFGDSKRLTKVDDRFDYQETRYETIGLIDKRVYVVIYTMRESVIRIISVRKANKREQTRYGNR